MHDTGDVPHRTGDPTSLSARVTDWQSAMTSCLIRAGVGRLFSRSPTSSKFFYVKESKRQRDQSVPVGFIKNLRMLNYKGVLNYLFLPQSRPDYSIKWLTNPSAFWNIFPNGLNPILANDHFPLEEWLTHMWLTDDNMDQNQDNPLYKFVCSHNGPTCLTIFFWGTRGGNVNHIGQHPHGSWNKFFVKATLSLTENMFGWWNAHRQLQFIIQTALWKKKNRRRSIFKWPFRQLVMPLLKIIRRKLKILFYVKTYKSATFVHQWRLSPRSHVRLKSNTIPDVPWLSPY